MSMKTTIDFESSFQRWKKRARKSSGEDFVVVDLGSASIDALRVKISPAGDVSVLDYASAPTVGYCDGAVVEAAHFVPVLKKVIGDVTRENRGKVKRLNVTFSAPFVSYITHFTSVNLPPRKRVTLSLVNEAVKAAREEISSLLEHVIQVVPVRYTLDSVYSGGEPPLGMGGRQLGMELLFVTAPEASLDQMKLAFNEAGYEVSEWWYSGISASESVFRPSAESGVAVVDIGAGSTDVSVYQHGKLLHVGVIEMGGRDIDNDLAVYLNESLHMAEEVKNKFGCALPQVIKYNEVINLRERGYSSTKMVAAREVASIIKKRAQELLFSVDEEIGKALPQNLISKVILCGGASKIQGLPELAEIVLGRSVELGVPCIANGTKMGFTDPCCAALIGTLKILRNKLMSTGLLDPAAMTFTQRLKSWAEALVSTPATEERTIS